MILSYIDYEKRNLISPRANIDYELIEGRTNIIFNFR